MQTRVEDNRRRDVKIAVLSDLHWSGQGGNARDPDGIGDILLARAVRRLNELVKPDLVLLVGDLIEDGTAPDAAERLEQLRTILSELAAPFVALPGNHEGDADAFYRVFERPSPIADLAGVRLLCFEDSAEPRHNARRTDRDIQRFRQARAGYAGPIVSAQHCCLFPPDAADGPYNYVNAPAILDAMREAQVTLSVSGHYHRGLPDVRRGATTFVNAPALCRRPFRFVVATLCDDAVHSQVHELAMTRAAALSDWHVHSQFAYCSKNMDFARAVQLAEVFGLHGLGFAEHSGQLYFDRDTYWSGRCLADGIGAAAPEPRIDAYFAEGRAFAGARVRIGLEIDCDYEGRPLVKPAAWKRAAFRIGAMHKLPGLAHGGATRDARAICEQFLGLLERFLETPIDILAHPFRVFRRAGAETPPQLFEPTAALLKRTGTAAELNFHTNRPPLEFVRRCLRNGVKLAFGSDAHHLHEIGDFSYNLALLEQAGFDGEPADVLLGW